MLLQFAVENYRSFHKKAVLSMVASSDEQHPHHVCTLPDGTRVLRCALIYGANASGKSNLVKALRAAARIIKGGVRPGEQPGLTPFRLAINQTAPVTFEFIVVLGGVRYSYGLSYQGGRVAAEWLYLTRGGAEELCFERELAPGADKAEIKLGDLFGDEQQRVAFVAQGTRAEQPFLTEAEERDVAMVKPLLHWLRSGLFAIAPDTPQQDLPLAVRENPELKDFIETMLRNAGTSISDLTVKTETSELESPTELPEAVAAPYMRKLRDQGFHVLAKADHIEAITLLARHTREDGSFVDFRLAEESDGTRRLLHLAPVLYWLNRAPSTIVLDELDRSLHPLLTRWYLSRFLAQDRAAGTGQLLCTTHDTGLMDIELLRADELWFVEKDPAQSSHLYSLAEFKREQIDGAVRIENQYLQGRFGAIPFFGSAAQLAGGTGE